MALTTEALLGHLKDYFPLALSGGTPYHETRSGRALIGRLLEMPKSPLSRTHLNQILHLSHEAGLSQGAFRYYFLTEPAEHPYPIDRLTAHMPTLHASGIASVEQLFLGVRRFFVDALLYFGNVREAYRTLRNLTFDEIATLFGRSRFDTREFQTRGPVLPFEAIPADDRYLIAELACKAYGPAAAADVTLLESELTKAYVRNGSKRAAVRSLVKLAEESNAGDLQAQLSFAFAAEEFMDAEVASEAELRERVSGVAARFQRARAAAQANTEKYLSLVNELDIYVATSMRNRGDFRDMAKNCKDIFGHEKLRPLHLRYFDPTNSAADCHEDKGLIECLMVKCAKALVYFAGEKDSFGKDSEVAMALSLGKPVVIYCPPTAEGEKRMRFFRDIHPLSRLIDVEKGIPVGAMITNRTDHVVDLLHRIFANEMEYDLDHDGQGYFRLRERLTNSVVRLHTNSRLLRESFWNYYHGVS